MAPSAVVQAFGFGRAALRYAERLAGHDAALRMLASRRVCAYDALARLAPAGLADYRSGDLITRLVTDVDSFADRWLRVRLPFTAAALASAGAVAVVGVLSPAAGLVLAATLVVAALAGPAVAVAPSRREERASSRCAATSPPPRCSFLTGWRNWPPSARTGAPSVPFRTRGAGLTKQRSVLDPLRASARRSARSRRERRSAGCSPSLFPRSGPAA